MVRYRLLPMLTLVSLLVACSADEKTDQGAKAEAAPKAAAGILPLSAAELHRIGVLFAPVEHAADMPIATVPGILAPPPNARVAVAAVIPGVVTRTLVVEGDSVRKGQALAIVTARELFTLGAGIEQASARVDVARANDRRLGQLAREGIIAGARADEARAVLREAQAELNEQRRIVRLVNGAPESGSYTLTAPIAGKITKASIQTGSPVSEATAAYVIDAVSRYELTAQLPERLLGQVRMGMRIGLPGEVYGEITSVGTVLDPETRSATLRAQVPPGMGMVSGRALPVTILAPAPSGAFVVPARAVVVMDGQASVFVRTAQGVSVQAVKAGDQANDLIPILSGLRAGDQIAISGMSELKAIAGQD
jgi:cobalt-zinc-cadmium efflux system membrane fusion protein